MDTVPNELLPPALRFIPLEESFLENNMEGSEGSTLNTISYLENNILHILLLAPYWNLRRTRKASLTEIENIYLDIQRWTSKRQKLFVPTNKDGSSSRCGSTVNKKHIRYTLNITGSFGSANL